MPEFILWLEKADKEDLDLIGNKAARLAQISHLSLPITRGFVITAEALHFFLEQSALAEKIHYILERSGLLLLEETSNIINQAITSAKIESNLKDQIVSSFDRLSKKGKKEVIVSPSLIIQRIPNFSEKGSLQFIKREQDFLQSVKQIWSLAFSPINIGNLLAKESTSLETGVAILVQEQFYPEVSGTLFTNDPFQGGSRLTRVEAIWGAAPPENVATIPDLYEVNKDSQLIYSKEISPQEYQYSFFSGKKRQVPVPKTYTSKQKLDEADILKLAVAAKKIESVFGFPQKVDWVLENKNLTVTNVEPIEYYPNQYQDPTETDLRLPLIFESDSRLPGIATGMPKIIIKQSQAHRVKPGDVAILKSINHDLIPSLKKASALILESKLDPALLAWLEANLNKPSVFGAKNATGYFSRSFSLVTVDGSRGKIFMGAFGPRKNNVILHHKKEMINDSVQNKTATKLFVTLSETQMIKEVSSKDVDGIGLLKSDSFFLDIGVHPKKFLAGKQSKHLANKLADLLVKFASAFDPRPVIYRPQCLTGSELASLKNGGKYEKDADRKVVESVGAAKYLADPEIFEIELEAIKIARNKHNLANIWLTIPYVRTVEEMEKIKKIVSSAGLNRSDTFKLLLEVDIPANILAIDKLLGVGIDGVCVNILQLGKSLLSTEKLNSPSTPNYALTDASLVSGLKIILESCRRKGLFTQVFGPASIFNQKLLDDLVSFGVGAISVPPLSIEEIRKIVSGAEENLFS